MCILINQKYFVSDAQHFDVNVLFKSISCLLQAISHVINLKTIVFGDISFELPDDKLINFFFNHDHTTKLCGL